MLLNNYFHVLHAYLEDEINCEAARDAAKYAHSVSYSILDKVCLSEKGDIWPDAVRRFLDGVDVVVEDFDVVDGVDEDHTDWEAVGKVYKQHKLKIIWIIQLNSFQ